MDPAKAIYTLFSPHPPLKSRAISTLVPKSSSFYYRERRPTRNSQPLQHFMDSSTTPQITSSPVRLPSTFHSSFRISSIPLVMSSLNNCSNEQFSNSTFAFTGPGPVALVTLPVQHSQPAIIPRTSIMKAPPVPPRVSRPVPLKVPPAIAPKPVKRQLPVQPGNASKYKQGGLPTEPPPLPSRAPVGDLPRALAAHGMSRFSAPSSTLRDQPELSKKPTIPPFEAPPEEFLSDFDDSMELPSTPNMVFDPAFASSPLQRLKVNHDPFFRSDLVIGLDNTNFTKFINTRDVVAVMFYDSKLPQSRELEKAVSQAACSTKRAGHSYAGVDCSANMILCTQHKATDLPMVRVYSKTYCLGELKNTVSSDSLRQRVEMAPPAEALRMVECSPCFKGK
ncbi:unnamed protein product [Candidula unifasciata]|uniref:Uncharacterized protein n=1 Tax=Candidula unifasciata TaxID=100452 RepID=A0A8S3ZZZ2_9EUPU|nr:unnamed protein product [Candidula unifasciata]